MPQLMPLFWLMSVIMWILLLLVLVEMYMNMNIELLYNMKSQFNFMKVNIKW